MAQVTEQAVRDALVNVIDPEIRQNVVELGMDGDVAITGGSVTVEIILTTPGCPLKDNLQSQVQRHVGAIDGVDDVAVSFGHMSDRQKAALKTKLTGGREKRDIGVTIPDDCRVIAIASGKGGVGKSTVAANVAAELAARGHEVGLIDADVHGYSVPLMLGVQQKPVTVDGMIIPPVGHGVRLMSIGFFLDEDKPVMWRGPMLHRALEQFLGDVHWGDIEYLVLDMPPGTGDMAISFGQLLPKAQVALVTTPQSAAKQVAARAGMMAKGFDQGLLGVVENMSDPADGPAVFGRGGGEAVADDLETRFLGRIDLNQTIPAAGDDGTPAVLAGGAAAEQYRAVLDAMLEVPAPGVPAHGRTPENDPSQRIKKPLAVL